MKTCTGAPAESNALQYVEGALPESERDQFEEHYFGCSVCLAHVRAIQALGQELAHNPVVPLRRPEPKISLGWPAWLWTAGALAALLLMSLFTYMSFVSRPVQPIASQSQPKSRQQAASVAHSADSAAAPIHLSKLADLTLPAFHPPKLRGESLDARFEAGMKEYLKSNCQGAVAALAQVPAANTNARAAEFYSGACQMRLGDFATASDLLRKVADVGDSPQQEAALYELAQIALVGNRAAAAQTYLKRTIALHGDLEEKASRQERRMTEMIGQDQAAKPAGPATK